MHAEDKWRILTEAALLATIALLVLAAAGAAVPLFRTILIAATALLALGVLGRIVLLLRAPTKREVSAGPMGAAARPGRIAPAARCRLLVADVDGTLIGAEQVISPRVRRAIAAARAAGVQVALCTGRSPAATQRFLAALDLPGPHIFFDGALIAALAASEDVHCCRPNPDALRDLAGLCREAAIPFELYTRGGHFAAVRSTASEWHSQVQGVPVRLADLDRLLAEGGVVKGELIGGPAMREAVAALAVGFSGRLRFSWAKVPGFPDYDLVNVVHPGVSKGEALGRLATFLDIPLSAVVAVGDGANDIPLLERAGLGIAMDDAAPAVKAAAGAVTASVAEDGLALAIERYVLV